MSVTPSRLYEAVARTLAVCANQPSIRFPLPQNSPQQFAAYAFDQEMEMLIANFPPAQRNVPSNAPGIFAGLADANAILTKLSPIKPTLGAKGRFSASFAVVPSSWDDFKTQGVTFPGWINTALSGQARTARSRNVTVRLHYDYFVVDPGNILSSYSPKDSSGNALTVYASMGSIPINLRNVWLNTLSGSAEANAEVNDLVVSGGVTVGTDTYLQTYPTTNQYKTWISNAATALGSHPWNSTYPTIWDGALSGGNIATAGQYQFADSTLRVYEGYIIERMTPYVIPQ